MKVSGVHWGVFLLLLVAGVALGNLLGQRWYDKQQEKAAAAAQQG